MRSPELDRWSGGAAGLQREGLLVSFQRYARPTAGFVTDVPRSLGALPVAAAPKDFLLPLYLEEAVWIGVMVRQPGLLPLKLGLVGPNGRRIALASITRVGNAVIAGIDRGDGSFTSLYRRSAARFLVRAGLATTAIIPVEPACYAEATGEPQPAPLDRAAGFGGYRLP